MESTCSVNTGDLRALKAANNRRTPRRGRRIWPSCALASWSAVIPSPLSFSTRETADVHTSGSTILAGSYGGFILSESC